MQALPIKNILHQRSEHIICVSDERNVRHSDLIRDVASLSAIIARCEQHRWVLAAQDSYHFLLGFLALICAGKDVLLPPNSQLGTLSDTLIDPHAILSDLKFELPIKHVQINPALYAAEFDLDITRFQEPCIEICTSGSTGNPQQIRKPLSCFEREIAALESNWGYAANSALFVSTVTHQHIYGLLFKVLWPLLSGRAFYNAIVEYPEQIEQLARHHDSLVLISSPAYLKRMNSLLDLPGLKSRIQLSFSSGGPLEREIALVYEKGLGKAPIEVLGSTETGGVAYRCQSVQQQQTPWTCFDEVEISIDSDRVLTIQSPYCFKQDWFRMGDTAEKLDEKHFRLLGRRDRIVKLEEKRVSLDNMESILVASAWVAQCKIVAIPGERTVLGAVCKLTDLGNRQLKELGRIAFAKLLKSHLSAYFELVTLPKKWRYVGELPYNSQGKVTIAAMLELFDKEQ